MAAWEPCGPKSAPVHCGAKGPCTPWNADECGRRPGLLTRSAPGARGPRSRCPGMRRDPAARSNAPTQGLARIRAGGSGLGSPSTRGARAHIARYTSHFQQPRAASQAPLRSKISHWSLQAGAAAGSAFPGAPSQGSGSARCASIGLNLGLVRGAEAGGSFAWGTSSRQPAVAALPGGHSPPFLN